MKNEFRIVAELKHDKFTTNTVAIRKSDNIGRNSNLSTVFLMKLPIEVLIKEHFYILVLYAILHWKNREICCSFYEV